MNPKTKEQILDNLPVLHQDLSEEIENIVLVPQIREARIGVAAMDSLRRLPPHNRDASHHIAAQSWVNQAISVMNPTQLAQALSTRIREPISRADYENTPHIMSKLPADYLNAFIELKPNDKMARLARGANEDILHIARQIYQDSQA